MNASPRIIFITGLPGSGKSAASETLIGKLQQCRFHVRFRTDKQALEEEVRRDIQLVRSDPSRHRANGTIEGNHTHLINPDGKDGTLQMVFKDGKALNSAHKQLLSEAQDFLHNRDDAEVFVIEWAYGKNVPYPGEELTHDGTQLVTWLDDHGLLQDVVILDIVSDEQTRIERNSNRPGHIPTGEFTKYFPEEGLFTAEDIQALDGRYIRIDNLGTSPETFQRFHEQVLSVYESSLLQLLEGRPQMGKEWMFIHYKEW